MTDNVFRLSDEARAELAGGSGKELGTEQRPGKLAAPWSSSALVANVFEYFRTESMGPVQAALELPSLPTQLRLEARFATGFSNLAPANLDVVLDCSGSPRVAVESKFLEPFDRSATANNKDDFSATYLDDARRRDWHELSGLLSLARAMQAGERRFYQLDVAQLVKHTLALKRDGRSFELILLWYSPPAEVAEATTMQQEIDLFSKIITRDGVSFRAMRYQDVFSRLRQATSGHDEYLTYLSSRYFDAPACA